MNDKLKNSQQRVEQSRIDIIKLQQSVPTPTKQSMFAHRGRPQQERIQRMENKRYLEQLKRQEENYTKQLKDINKNMEDFRRRDRRIIERNLIVQQRQERRKNFSNRVVKEKKNFPGLIVKEESLPLIPEVSLFKESISSIPKRRIVRGIKRKGWRF